MNKYDYAEVDTDRAMPVYASPFDELRQTVFDIVKERDHLRKEVEALRVEMDQIQKRHAELCAQLVQEVRHGPKAVSGGVILSTR